MHSKPPVIRCENPYPRPILWLTGPSPQGGEQGGLDGPFGEPLSPARTFQAIYFERDPVNANGPAPPVVPLPSLRPVAQIFGQRVLLSVPPFLGTVIPLSEWHLRHGSLDSTVQACAQAGRHRAVQSLLKGHLFDTLEVGTRKRKDPVPQISDKYRHECRRP